jgi:hypothetical protein
MIFSPTPLRFSEIMFSADRLKLPGRAAIKEMIVFSLNPALASLTIAAFVNVPSVIRVCAQMEREVASAIAVAKRIFEASRFINPTFQDADDYGSGVVAAA